MAGEDERRKPGALQGIRVIEFGHFQVGPVAGALLGDLGAEIIKVEPPGQGDPARGVTRIFGTVDCSVSNGGSAYFEINNRSKKGITVDISKEKGKEIIYRLIAKSDVFLVNFRGGVAEKLGYGYEALKSINPKLVYASVTGYGPKGPDAMKPSLDPSGQARSGLMYTFGEPGTPPLYGTCAPADQMGALMTAYGILAALVARERTGIGQEVSASMLNATMWLMGMRIGMELISDGAVDWPRYSRANAGSPLMNYYLCGDGRWLQLSIFQNQRYWPIICKALDLAELEHDPRFETDKKRFENRKELLGIFDKVFATRTAMEWEEILNRHDILFDQVKTTSELAEDPQVLANDYVVDLDHPNLGKVKMLNYPATLSETPGTPRCAAPELGQNTEEVLLEVGGYTWEEISAFRDAEVI